MSNAEAGAAATPNYGATPPSTSAKSKLADAPGSRAKTGFAFLGTLYGVLDIIILVKKNFDFYRIIFKYYRFLLFVLLYVPPQLMPKIVKTPISILNIQQQ